MRQSQRKRIIKVLKKQITLSCDTRCARRYLLSFYVFLFVLLVGSLLKIKSAVKVFA